MAENIRTSKSDRANIPSTPACGQWETLLADALDGLLRPEDEAVFSAHMAICASCTEMFEQARRGREWLEFLAPEPEVPAYLLDKILVETGHGKLDSKRLVVAGGPASGLGTAGNVLTMTPAWQRPGFAGRMRRFAEPRLLMTAAMAFFSIALTLSLTGVRITSLKTVDLRPSAVRFELEKRIMTASTPIVRYYDHLRFVYEVESSMRELRRTTQGGQGGTGSEPTTQQPDQNKTQPGGEGQSHRKDGGSNRNPNDAPQQTVNPPAPLWGSDALEAELESPLGFSPQNHPTTREMNQTSKGLTTHTQASGLTESGQSEAESTETSSIEARVLAMPERSIPCIA
jgi:hypothetical protein